MNIFYFLSSAALILGIADIAFLKTSINKHQYPELQQKESVPVEPTVNIPADTTFNSSDTYLTSVYFSLSSTKLNSIQKSRLNKLISATFNKENAVFILDGYSDSSGSGIIDNDLIATLRAYAVHEYLINLGLKRDNIFIRTFGMHTQENNSKIRRKVDIYTAEAGYP